jgi:hypothetical protein
MNETCDRCGPALSAQGWSIRLAGEHEHAPQGRVAKPGTVTRARRITPAGSGGIYPRASRNLN